jgi:hypothetical protein
VALAANQDVAWSVIKNSASGRAHQQSVDGMNLSALEFSHLASDIPSPTAFTGALQSDQ